MLTINSLFYDSGDNLEQYNNTTEILKKYNTSGHNYTGISLRLNSNETLVKDFDINCIFIISHLNGSGTDAGILEIPENINVNVNCTDKKKVFELHNVLKINNGNLNIGICTFRLYNKGYIIANGGSINFNQTIFKIESNWIYNKIDFENITLNIIDFTSGTFSNCSEINFKNVNLNIQKLSFNVGSRKNELIDLKFNFVDSVISYKSGQLIQGKNYFLSSIDLKNSTLQVYGYLQSKNITLTDSTLDIINTSESIYGTFDYFLANINNSDINIDSLCSFNQTNHNESNFINVNIQNNSGSIVIQMINADNLKYTSSSINSNAEIGGYYTCNFNNSTLTNEGGTIKLKGEVYFKNSNYISTNSNSTLLTTKTNTFTNSNIYFYNGILTNEGKLTIEKMGNMSCNFLTLNNIKSGSSILIKLFNPIYFSNSTLNLLSISNVSVKHICFMGQNSKIVIGKNTYKSHFDKIDNKPITDYNYYFIYDTSKLNKVDSFETTLNSHSTQISNLNTEVGIDSKGTATDSGLKKNVSTLTEQLNNLNNTAGNLQDQIDGINVTIGDENDGIVKDISDLQKQIGNKENGIVKDISDLQSYNSTNDLNISSLNSNVSKLQEQVNGINKTVGDNKSETDKKISDLSSTVDSNVSDLLSKINVINGKIEYKENEETKYISNLYSTVKSNKSEFDTFKQNTENTINEKQTQITTNTTDISNLKTNFLDLNKIVKGDDKTDGLVKTVDKNTSDILTLKDTVNDIKAGGSTIEEALKQTIKNMSAKVDNLDVVVNDSENGLIKKMENADSDILRIYDCIGEINDILDIEDVDEILERKKEEFSSVLDKILDIIEKRPQEISSNNLKMFVLSLMMIKNRK